MFPKKIKKFIKKIVFIAKNKIPRHVVTFKEIEHLHENDNFKTLIIIPELTTKSYFPIYEDSISFENRYEQGTLESVKVLNIKNAKVIGESNVIVFNNNDAIYNHNINNNIDYSDGALRDYKDVYKITDKSKIYYKDTALEIPEAISMCINYGFNYYHFVLECLSKFYLIDILKLPNEVPLLVDSIVTKIPQFIDLLKIFNQDRRKVVFVNKRESVLVHNLYTFSPIHYLPANYLNHNKISASSVLFNYKVIDYIKNKILESSQKTNKISRKVYLSRANYSKRSYNDSEIKDFLSKNGFETIYPEKLSIQEQVNLFGNANIIVGASGAALTNIVFCKKNTKIIVLAAQKLSLSVFSSIAAYFQLKMIYVTGNPKDKNNLHSSFYISPTKLDKVLKLI